MSFFDRLRKGVLYIETEVKKLKEITENGDQLSDEQLVEDLTKAKNYESKVRQTYSEISCLFNEIKSAGDPLMASKDRILEMKQMLVDIEDNSGIKKYGYTSFAERYFAEDDQQNKPLDRPEPVRPEVARRDQYLPPVVNNPFPKTNGNNMRQLSEEFTKKSTSSEEKTFETIRFAPDIPEVSKKEFRNNLKTYDVKIAKEEKSDEKITKKYDKLLSRTPQLQDFGLTRRFTILPPVYNMPETKSYDQTEPTDWSQTCRFNYTNNGFNLVSNAAPITPPNPDHSQAADSFVTVEFTPGLTTKRPKGISRVNNGYDNQDNGYQNNQMGYRDWSKPPQVHRMPQSVLQSVENDKVTPEQPIPTVDSAKSAHLLKTIAAKNNATPPLPKSRVDPNFHRQLLKNL